MSRFFFHILADPGDGDLEFDTSIDVGDLAVDLDGSPAGLSFTQVGDGYYFDYTASGLYTISISAVDQDEFTNIPLIAIEDNIDTTMLQSVKGYIYSSGGFLRLYTDGSSPVLDASDVVDDLTTGGAAVPLSAAQGVILNTKILNAIKARDSANFGTSLNGNARRMIYSDFQVASAADGNEAAAVKVYTESASSYKIKIRFPYYRISGENKLIIICDAYATGDDMVLKVSLDGTTANIFNISWAAWHEDYLEIPLDDFGGGIFEVTVNILNVSGVSYMRNVMIFAE